MFSAIREKKYPLIEWLLIATTIVISDDTLLFGTNSNSYFVSFKYAFIVTMSLLGFSWIILYKNSIFIKECFVVFLMIFLILLSSFYNDDLRMGLGYKIILFTFAYFITKKIKITHFMEIFSNVMLFLCLYSLIFWITSLVDKSLLSFLPQMTNVGQNSYANEFYNAFFAQVRVYDTMNRNYGMFREPGVFQMFICYAILFQIISQNKNRSFPLFIYFLTLISTFSTTGYLALIVLSSLLIKKQFDLGVIKNKNLILLIFLVFLIPVFLNTSVAIEKFGNIFGKFSDVERVTTISRFASVSENLRIFGDSPIFGVGLTGLKEKFPIYAFESYGYASKDNTNMILIQFATHGLIYGLFFIFLQYNFCKNLFMNLFDRLLAFLLFVILYCGENMSFSVIPYVFLFYGLNMNNNEICVKKNDEKLRNNDG